MYIIDDITGNLLLSYTTLTPHNVLKYHIFLTNPFSQRLYPSFTFIKDNRLFSILDKITFDKLDMDELMFNKKTIEFARSYINNTFNHQNIDTLYSIYKKENTLMN